MGIKYCHQEVFWSYLVELVLLAELHALSPAVVALVKVSSDTSELNQLVFLQPLRQVNGVEVVIGINGRSKALRITHSITSRNPEG